MDRNPGTESKICPSSTCHEGALLIGVVQSDKRVAFIQPAIPVNADFVEKVTVQGNPEKRFRFAGKCIKSGCSQWTGTSCGVMNELSQANPLVTAAEEDLVDCMIRPRCRWYSQDGAKACSICPFVITHTEMPAGGMELR